MLATVANHLLVFSIYNRGVVCTRRLGWRRCGCTSSIFVPGKWELWINFVFACSKR
ncbi:hypothetical protein Hanom_Chr12g01169081 [Helianthus anomalus]